MIFISKLFASQSNRRAEEAQQQMEPPEISWENSLGSRHGVPFDDDTKELLKICLDVSLPPPTSLPELIKRSDAFPVKFPIGTMRCAALKDRGISAETIEVCAKRANYSFSDEKNLFNTNCIVSIIVFCTRKKVQFLNIKSEISSAIFSNSFKIYF